MEEFAADFIIENGNPIQAEYEVNESEHFDCSFELFAAGTTWGSITGTLSNQTDLQNALNSKQDVLTAGNNIQIENNVISATDTTYTAGQGIDITNGVISNTQTSAEWGNIQGDISDQTDLQNALNEKQDTISDLSTIREDASEGASAYSTIQNYGDIVTYNAANFATSAQGALANTALQPNDNISELTNDAGYITAASLPTVNNASLTIQRNGSQVVVFTANDSTNKTANILVPTQASDIGALPDTTTIADLTTQAQLDAINSGATATNIGQITTNENDIADIQDLIPLQATSSNQLADKSFVNSSIATNTAYFIGTFNSVAELEAYSGPLTNNDYAFVATTDTAGNTLYDRYKYNADTQEWLFEYELNNSSFTAAQWASINSGITSGDVSLIQTALQPNDNVSELVNDAGYITSASLPTVNNGTLDIQVNGTSIGTFTANQSGNTTANIVVPDSATWGNITGTLSNQTDLQDALGAKQDVISDLSTIRSGAGLGATALQPNDNISELVNNVGYITGVQWGGITGTLSNQTDLNSVLNEKMTFVVGELPEATADDVDKVIYQVNSANEVRSYKGYASEYEEDEWAEAVLDTSTPTIGGIDIDISVFKDLYQVAYGEKTEEWWEEAFETFPTFTLTREEIDGSYYGRIYWDAYSDINPLDENIYAAFKFYDEDWEEEIDINDIESATWDVYYYPAISYTEYHWSLLKISNATTSWGSIQGSINSQTDLKNALAAKQDTLVSGTNIKTINNNSILGSGNLVLDGLPSQTGQSGKFLTTDGTNASWATVAIPTPTYDSVNERITW